MPDQKVAIPDEWVDVGCEAAFVPPISADRRADLRAALEAVLPKVRERVLDQLATESPESPYDCDHMGAVEEAFNAAFPLDESDEQPWTHSERDGAIGLDESDPDQKGR